MKKDPVNGLGQPFKRTYKMTIDPVKRVGFMVMLLNILLLGLVLASIFDNEKHSMFISSILFLQTSMIFVYTAFKHLQKRIDALEEKLDTNQTEKA